MKSGINYDFYDFNLSLPLKYPSILLSYENFKHMTSVHFVFALRNYLILLKIIHRFEAIFRGVLQ